MISISHWGMFEGELIEREEYQEFRFTPGQFRAVNQGQYDNYAQSANAFNQMAQQHYNNARAANNYYAILLHGNKA